MTRTRLLAFIAGRLCPNCSQPCSLAVVWPWLLPQLSECDEQKRPHFEIEACFDDLAPSLNIIARLFISSFRRCVPTHPLKPAQTTYIFSWA